MQQPANARNRFIGIFGFIALIIIIVLGVIKAGDMGVGRSVAQFPNISTGNKSNILLDSNSTDAQPSKGPNINIPDVVADTGGAGPQDLARVVKGWATEARDNIEKIQQESTMQSIAMMADYDSNYLKLITQAQMRPALPESIDFIVKSRRFAKIVQQIHDGDQTSLRVETIAQLNLDIDHWKYLKSHGQDINAEVIQLSGLPGSEPGNLIVPLNLRINAILLLLAQNPKAEDISIVSRYIDVFGEDANYALAGFLSEGAIKQLSSSSAFPATKEIVDEWRQWAALPEVSATLNGENVMIPDFREIVRPNERLLAVRIVQKNGPEFPPLMLKAPVTFEVTRLNPKSPRNAGKGKYGDHSNGKLEINKKAVKFALLLDPIVRR